MSCTLMYQPYAMSYSPSCGDRSSASDRQKLFKFPHVPSPPDSSHSGGSSYSGHSSLSASSVAPSLNNLSIPLIPTASSSLSLSLSAAAAGHFNTLHSHAHSLSPGSRSAITSRRSLTPCASNSNNSGSTGPPATIISATQSHHHQPSHHHHSSHHTSHTPRSSSATASATVTNSSGPSGLGLGTSGPDLQHSASSTATSHIHHNESSNHQSTSNSNSNTNQNQGPSGNSGGHRAQYLSANCIVYENYDGDSSREVDEHFSKALSAAYASEKPAKGLPMQTRNFPPSFWNSAYQPPPTRPLTSYGAGGDFYGSAGMDYTPTIPGLTHHHQTDPWHYPLTSHHHHHHQAYHHHHHRAAADLAYNPIASTSRFTPAQYGSFLFPGAAASSAAAASRFPALTGSAQCGVGVGVKGEGGHWGAGGRYHPHESSWTDFHLADYSAAAAHYSNMTAAGFDFESHYLQSS